MDDIVINGIKYVPEIKTEKNFVIIKSKSAGVFYGDIVAEEGQVVTLTNARRVWSWAGAATLSQMALEGVKNPGECKITQAVPLIKIFEVIEIIPCTPQAKENLMAVPEWKAT